MKKLANLLAAIGTFFGFFGGILMVIVGFDLVNVPVMVVGMLMTFFSAVLFWRVITKGM